MKHIKKFNEGVADEYAEKRYGFKNPKKDFEFQYQNYIAKIPPVAYVKEADNDKLIAIFKNPKTLTNFEENVRAIGTIDGDLYVAQRDESFYHSMMGLALELVPKGSKIYDLNDKFVFLYRLRDKNAFAIGVSTEFFNDDGEESVKITENILKKIKGKNPQFSFYNYTKSQIYAKKPLPVTLDITKYEPEQIPEIKKTGMFTKFKKFIKNESFEEKPNIQEVKEKVENEFSKYLKMESSDDFKNDSLRLFKSNNIETSDNIFLLDNDYGCRISNIMIINKGIHKDIPKYIVQVRSIKTNPRTSKFRDGNLVDNYDSKKSISIEEFVKKFVDKLKRTNEQRLKNRETVKLKRMSNKFNL